MQIADRLKKIRPSMTLAINAKAQEMRKNGLPVISLAVGEPDFHTPEFVKKAAKKAIDENFTKYTPVAGIPELRKAAANYFNHYYSSDVKPENIIIGAGGKQCLHTFMQTTLNPGDEVIIPVPYWVSYPDMALLADAKTVFIESDLKNGFKISTEDLDKAYSEKTRLLILNSPSNPTGSIYSQQELEKIVNWCLKKNIFLLSDEIYDQLVYPPAKMASAINYFKNFPENIAVVNGLSKSFAMTGWRIGFLAAHKEIIGKMSQVQSHSLANISSITQMAALAALAGPDEEVIKMRKAFSRRRDLAIESIKNWEKAICPKPEGAFYLFVDMSAYYTKELSNSLLFCEWLLEKAGVATVPGAAFGNDKCIRLSFAVSDDTFITAIQKISEALKTLN